MVDIRFLLQQKFGQLPPVMLRSHAQSRIARLILGIDIGPVLHQEFRHRPVPFPDGQHQRRHPLFIPGIDGSPILQQQLNDILAVPFYGKQQRGPAVMVTVG